MPSPLVPALSDELSLGGPVINNSMTLGQLRLLARCVRQSLNDIDFRSALSDEELEETQSLIAMFNDPELETAPADIHHGFCL